MIDDILNKRVGGETKGRNGIIVVVIIIIIIQEISIAHNPELKAGAQWESSMSY